MRISDWSSDVCSSDLTSNGRDVRAKDVALIFADAATRAHSPALVSPGKIANVIAAKPTDRRATLEEPTGIVGLHVRRTAAEQKPSQTETHPHPLSETVPDTTEPDPAHKDNRVEGKKV